MEPSLWPWTTLGYGIEYADQTNVFYSRNPGTDEETFLTKLREAAAWIGLSVIYETPV